MTESHLFQLGPKLTTSAQAYFAGRSPGGLHLTLFGEPVFGGEAQDFDLMLPVDTRNDETRVRTADFLSINIGLYLENKGSEQ